MSLHLSQFLRSIDEDLAPQGYHQTLIALLRQFATELVDLRDRRLGMVVEDTVAHEEQLTKLAGRVVDWGVRCESLQNALDLDGRRIASLEEQSQAHDRYHHGLAGTACHPELRAQQAQAIPMPNWTAVSITRMANGVLVHETGETALDEMFGFPNLKEGLAFAHQVMEQSR